MWLRTKYRSFRKKLKYAFNTPDCVNCGQNLYRERMILKPSPSEREYGKLYSLMLSSAYLLLTGSIVTILAVSARIYYSGGFTVLATSGIIVAIIGLIGMMAALPFNEYHRGKVSRKKLDKHPLCYECLKEENKELWDSFEDLTHADYL